MKTKIVLSKKGKEEIRKRSGLGDVIICRPGAQQKELRKNITDVYRIVKRLGIPYSNYCTDLYIPVNSLTLKIIRK